MKSEAKEGMDTMNAGTANVLYIGDSLFADLVGTLCAALSSATSLSVLKRTPNLIVFVRRQTRVRMVYCSSYARSWLRERNSKPT
jgi:predicted HAD superfamily phosphohydrolase YqeG